MNIDDLTIGEAKQLAGIFSGEKEIFKSNSMVGRKCIIRTYSAGVWYGKVEEQSGNEIYLTYARRINFFKTIKGISLSSVANNGVHSDSKIAEPVDIIWLQPIEIIACTATAINSIEGHDHE